MRFSSQHSLDIEKRHFYLVYQSFSFNKCGIDRNVTSNRIPPVAGDFHTSPIGVGLDLIDLFMVISSYWFLRGTKILFQAFYDLDVIFLITCLFFSLSGILYQLLGIEICF